MIKYLILFGFIFFCFGCMNNSALLYKENTKNYIVEIRQFLGRSPYIQITERTNKGTIKSHINFYCDDVAMIHKYKSRGGFAAGYFDDQFFYSITDTNGGYFCFGAKVASKNNQIDFQPLTDNQKRWLKIASEKTTFDSCKYYVPSQVIGFIPKPQKR